MKVLVLCHGNINRSPLSAAVIRKEAGKIFQVRSAGFVNPNRRAAKKMRDAALELGINLEEHRSQLVDIKMAQWSNLVLFMDNGNLRRMKELFNGRMQGLNVSCLGNWAEGGPISRIPDPAFLKRGTKEFHDSVKLINECSINFVQHMIANADPLGA